MDLHGLYAFHRSKLMAIWSAILTPGFRPPLAQVEKHGSTYSSPQSLAWNGEPAADAVKEAGL